MSGDSGKAGSGKEPSTESHGSGRKKSLVAAAALGATAMLTGGLGLMANQLTRAETRARGDRNLFSSETNFTNALDERRAPPPSPFMNLSEPLPETPTPQWKETPHGMAEPFEINNIYEQNNDVFIEVSFLNGCTGKIKLNPRGPSTVKVSDECKWCLKDADHIHRRIPATRRPSQAAVRAAGSRVPTLAPATNAPTDKPHTHGPTQPPAPTQFPTHWPTHVETQRPTCPPWARSAESLSSEAMIPAATHTHKHRVFTIGDKTQDFTFFDNGKNGTIAATAALKIPLELDNGCKAIVTIDPNKFKLKLVLTDCTACKAKPKRRHSEPPTVRKPPTKAKRTGRPTTAAPTPPPTKAPKKAHTHAPAEKRPTRDPTKPHTHTPTCGCEQDGRRLRRHSI